MTSLGYSASADTLNCQTLNTFNTHSFINVGKLSNSCRILECGTITNGKEEITAYINADGTCSFINQDISSFTSLSDVPHSYDGKNNSVVVVKEDGLNFSSDVILESIKVTSKSILGEVSISNGAKISNGLITDCLKVECGITQQSGDFMNVFKAPSNFGKINADTINSPHINSSSIYSSLALLVDGEATLGTIKTESININGKGKCKSLECPTLFGETYTGRDMLLTGTLAVGDTIATGALETEKIKTKEFTSGSVVCKNLKVEMVDMDNLKVKSIITDSISVPSKLLFGTVDEPMVFNLNNFKSIDVPFKLSDGSTRGYGYGFCPNRCNDTIDIIVYSPLSLSKNKVNVSFQYYNLNTATAPSVFVLGSIITPIDSDSFNVVLKLSGNLPVVPYWLIDLEIIHL